MTNQRRRLPLLLLLLPCCAMAPACAGARAREHALLPALVEVWPRIREGMAREAAAQGRAEASGVVEAADVALRSGDLSAIAAVPWPLLDELALADVQRRAAAGQLGPDVVPILRGRLEQFAAQRTKLLRSSR